MEDRSVLKARAEARFKERDYEEALRLYRQLHEGTRESKYLYNSAICLYYLSRISDAAGILEGLAAARAMYPDSAIFLGFCYRSLNQTGRARVHFEALARESSGETRIKCRLMVALLLDESGEAEAAEKAYETLMADPDLVAKNRAEVCRRMATLKENRKDHSGALTLYRESLAHDEEGEPALAAKFRMAVCLLELSAQLEAVELLKQVEDLAKGSFLGESAAKLLAAVQSSVRRTDRHIGSYE
ncbi:hypothetical protein HY522_06790 [bacterium]|nr:hypothetical protein [bacterium]